MRVLITSSKLPDLHPTNDFIKVPDTAAGLEFHNTHLNYMGLTVTRMSYPYGGRHF